MSRSIMWFRRDLRLTDNPALLAAIDAGEEIVPVFILDPKLIDITGAKGLAYLAASLRSLDESLGNKLNVCEGDPVDVLKDLIKKHGATSVHISAEYDAYAVARDARVGREGAAHDVAPHVLQRSRHRAQPRDGTFVDGAGRRAGDGARMQGR